MLSHSHRTCCILKIKYRVGYINKTIVARTFTRIPISICIRIKRHITSRSRYIHVYCDCDRVERHAAPTKRCACKCAIQNQNHPLALHHRNTCTCIITFFCISYYMFGACLSPRTATYNTSDCIEDI